MSEQTAATIHVGVISSAVASVSSSCAIQPPSGLHYSYRKRRNKGNVNRLASPGRKRGADSLNIWPVLQLLYLYMYIYIPKFPAAAIQQLE